MEQNVEEAKNPVIKDWIIENKKMVGMMRIELTTFCPPDKRANQAALHPDLMISNILFFFHLSSRK